MGIVRCQHTKRATQGQMTVELAVCIPVLITVSLVLFNALTFFEQCASFDCLARDAIRIYATSPASGQSANESAALVQESLANAFAADNIAITVNSSFVGFGFVQYRATIAYAPTLFGRKFSGQVFGTSLGTLRHSVQLTVDPFKPGVLF